MEEIRNLLVHVQNCIEYAYLESLVVNFVFDCNFLYRGCKENRTIVSVSF